MVLWMTSCFRITKSVRRIRDDAYVSSSSPGGSTGGKVCRLRLHVVLQPKLHLSHCSLTSWILFWALQPLLHCFPDLVQCNHMIQMWAIRQLQCHSLARWIMRSHMQYVTEIRSSCTFLVWRSTVETHLKWGGKTLQLCAKFPLEPVGERILKISPYSPKLWSKANVLLYRQTLYMYPEKF